MEAETGGGEGWDPRLDCGSVESSAGGGRPFFGCGKSFALYIFPSIPTRDL